MKVKTESELAQTNEGCLTKLSEFVDTKMSGAFYQLGIIVGTYPFRTKLFAVLLVLACASGFSKLETENRPEKLWIPVDTRAVKDQAKLIQNFPRNLRVNTAILTPKEGSNVLTKEVLLAAMDFHNEIVSFKVEALDQEWTWNNICQPAGFGCLISSILSEWNFNRELLVNDTDILATLNANYDPAAIRSKGVGGITVVDNKVTAARALQFVYFLKNQEVFEGGRGVDKPGETWEKKFLDISLAEHEGIVVHPQATRSFSDEFGGAIQGDLGLLSTGYLLIIVYLSLNLGKFDRVSSRVALSCSGLITVGMAAGLSFGISAHIGYKFTSLHSILPFILLGLGVDNCFVIANAFDQTNLQDSVPKRMADALSHAGVSITVTSLTDFVAFGLGAITELPALASFCVFASFGIFGLYIMQITWFAASTVIDARRQENARLDCLCCFKSSKQRVSDKVEQGYVSKFLGKVYGPFLMKTSVRIAVVIVFLAFLGVGIFGFTQLTVESSERSFLPDGSYVLDTLLVQDRYFGDSGTPIFIVTETFNYHEKQDKLLKIKTVLENKENELPFVKDPNGPTFRYWYISFVEYLAQTSPNSLDENNFVKQDEFYPKLVEFLNGAGRQYSPNVIFTDDSKTKIKVARIEAEHTALGEFDSTGSFKADTALQVEAMDSLREIMDGIGIPVYSFSFAYLDWEQFKIIEKELRVNLTLALTAVFSITLVLIASPLTSGLVFICVLFTLLDIAGVMYLWGIVIDSVAVVNLILAVGLSVDYSAHIGHCFMVKSGSREERAIQSLADIGSPVINGAFSTFLAIVMLAFSNSYVFRVLFQLFFSTCTFGVLHGLVLLPVLLSFIGPDSYARVANGHSHGEKDVETAANGLQ